MADRSSDSKTGLLSPVAFCAGLFLLALSPWVRGGNRHVALWGLELLSLLILTVLAWRLVRQQLATDTPSMPTRLEWALILSPVWMGAVQILPLPSVMVSLISGTRPWMETASVSQLSVAPDLTLTSMLAALPVAAAFLLGRLCRSAQALVLTRAVLVLGMGVALMGLMQRTHFGEWLYFDAEFAGTAIGPFANHNHFADWLFMLLPLALWQFREQLADMRNDARGWLGLALHAGVLVVLLAAIVASGSRSGVGIALGVALTSCWMLWWKPGAWKRHKWKLLAGGLVCVLVLALVADPRGLVHRLGAGQLADDAGLRWRVTTSTWEAALAYLPLGSGLGTYAVAYPAFQPPAMGGFFPHAHNDYVQYLMEVGLLFPLALWLFWRLLRPSVVAVWSWVPHRKRPADYALHAVCWVALAGLAAHSWVDFSLRIPANAMLAALLLGWACRPLAAAAHAPHKEAEDAGPMAIIPHRKPHGHRRSWRSRIRRRLGLG